MGYFLWGVTLLLLVVAILYKHGIFNKRGLFSAIPQLPYINESETLAFYKEVLKFDIMSNWEGYILTKKDAIEIHLWKCNDPVIPKNTGCYIRVNKNIEALYSDYNAKGIMHEHGKLEIKPWGMKQFSLLDNSGNIIHFGQNA